MTRATRGHPPRPPQPPAAPITLRAGDFLSVREAAALLAVHPESVRRWARAGRLRCFRAGRDLRFRRADLIAWVSGSEG